MRSFSRSPVNRLFFTRLSLNSSPVDLRSIFFIRYPFTLAFPLFFPYCPFFFSFTRLHSFSFHFFFCFFSFHCEGNGSPVACQISTYARRHLFPHNTRLPPVELWTYACRDIRRIRSSRYNHKVLSFSPWPL